MISKPTTTQQINAYVRHQQLLQAHLQLLQAIKKAEHPNQEVSAFTKQVIRLIKSSQPNQITHGVNQYATV